MPYLSFKKIWSDVAFISVRITAENETMRCSGEFYVQKEDLKALHDILVVPSGAILFGKIRECSSQKVIHCCNIKAMQATLGKINIEIEMKIDPNNGSFYSAKFDLNYAIESSMVDDFLPRLDKFYDSNVETEIKLGF